MIAAGVALENGGDSDGLGCTRLAQRMGAGDALVGKAQLDDAPDGWMAVDIAAEIAHAHTVAHEADIGERQAVAMAIGARLLLAAKAGFIGIEALFHPVESPFVHLLGA